MKSSEANSWHDEKTYDSLITYGVNALKFVMLSNGGAILALLSFLGAHFEKMPNLKCALIVFVTGVGLGGCAHLTAYMTQLMLFNQKQRHVPLFRNHVTWLRSTMLLLLVGIGCFMWGSIVAVSGLEPASVHVKSVAIK